MEQHSVPLNFSVKQILKILDKLKIVKWAYGNVNVMKYITINTNQIP